MKKLILILTICLLALIYLPKLTLYLYADKYDINTEPQLTDQVLVNEDDTINYALRTLVEEWSKELPMQIDRATTWYSVSQIKDRTITSKFLINIDEFTSGNFEISNAELEEVVTLIMKPFAANIFCKDNIQLLILQEYNITYENEFYDQADNYLTSFNINKNDCAD
jgi:hypothetical protein